jgi:replication factor A1
VSDFNRTNVPFSLEMVLMDADGDKIHATIKKTLIYKFKNELIEGKVYCLENLGVATNSGAYRSCRHPYKLNFQYSSLVQRLSNFEILKSPYNFVPISEVVGGSYDCDFLVGEFYLACLYLFICKIFKLLTIWFIYFLCRCDWVVYWLWPRA